MILGDYIPKILCPECKSKGKLPERRIMGDGYCKKHGCFPFYEIGLKERCDNCAKEKKICQRCGKNMGL